MQRAINNNYLQCIEKVSVFNVHTAAAWQIHNWTDKNPIQAILSPALGKPDNYKSSIHL